MYTYRGIQCYLYTYIRERESKQNKIRIVDVSGVQNSIRCRHLVRLDACCASLEIHSFNSYNIVFISLLCRVTSSFVLRFSDHTNLRLIFIFVRIAVVCVSDAIFFRWLNKSSSKKNADYLYHCI